MSGNVRILLTLVDRVDLIVSFRSFSGCGLAHHPSFLGAVAVCLRKHRLRVAGLGRECQAKGFGLSLSTLGIHICLRHVGMDRHKNTRLPRPGFCCCCSRKSRNARMLVHAFANRKKGLQLAVNLKALKTRPKAASKMHVAQMATTGAGPRLFPLKRKG